MTVERRNGSRWGLVLLVALNATVHTTTRAEDQPSRTASNNEEITRLRAYGTELLRQIETLRADLAASEKARKEAQDLLDSMSRRLQDDLAARQANDAAEARRREQEVVRTRREFDSAKASEAREAARSADLEKTAVALRSSIEQRESEHRNLEAQITSLQRARLEAADGAQRALREEKRVSQSKLETLQSVLQNTRSAGAGLRAQLDEARQRNSTLSRQVSDLQVTVRKVHELQTALQQKELRVQELAHTHDADAAELRELRSQQGSIETALRKAKSEQLTRTASLTQPMNGPTDPPPASESPAALDGEQSGADLREQLSLERERRETLEREVQRLTANGNAEEKFVEGWKALQSARSEILILSNQLADERRNREGLEVALARMKQENGGEAQSTNEFAERLARTLSERRAEADRLAEELKNANEVIVRLKGRLEANESPTADNKILADLDRENKELRDAIKAAEEANRKLQDKADMAQRLAEMVYGKMQ